MASKAFLDVSEVLFDPEIACSFTVYRRTQSVSTHGRASRTETATEALGVICTASGNDLRRLPEEERMDRVISVVTKTLLQGPSPGKSPDEIGWGGSRYVVRSVDLYPQYGQGFIQAICTSKTMVDPAPAAGAS